MSFSLIDRIRENNNQLWEGAREYYLDDFLKSAYRDTEKRKLIQKWIGGREKKGILIRQVEPGNFTDYSSDFLLIEFMPDKFDVRIIDMKERAEADVEMDLTHLVLVTATASLLSFIEAWLRKDIRLGKLWANPRDHWYAIRIFFRSEV